jgi:T5orf172 domain
MMRRGYIYCLSNPAMPGLLKIGYTEKTVEERVKSLYSTGVPMQFVIELKKYVYEPRKKEQYLHMLFTQYRCDKKREFFAIPLSLVKSEFHKIEGISDTTIISINSAPITYVSPPVPSYMDNMNDTIVYQEPIQSAVPKARPSTKSTSCTTSFCKKYFLPIILVVVIIVLVIIIA